MHQFRFLIAGLLLLVLMRMLPVFAADKESPAGLSKLTSLLQTLENGHQHSQPLVDKRKGVIWESTLCDDNSDLNVSPQNIQAYPRHCWREVPLESAPPISSPTE